MHTYSLNSDVDLFLDLVYGMAREGSFGLQYTRLLVWFNYWGSLLWPMMGVCTACKECVYACHMLDTLHDLTAGAPCCGP